VFEVVATLVYSWTWIGHLPSDTPPHFLKLHVLQSPAWINCIVLAYSSSVTHSHLSYETKLDVPPLALDIPCFLSSDSVVSVCGNVDFERAELPDSFEYFVVLNYDSFCSFNLSDWRLCVFALLLFTSYSFVNDLLL
jgi:hypothetical protein